MSILCFVAQFHLPSATCKCKSCVGVINHKKCIFLLIARWVFFPFDFAFETDVWVGKLLCHVETANTNRKFVLCLILLGNW